MTSHQQQNQESPGTANGAEPGHGHGASGSSLASAFIYTSYHTLACTFLDIPGPFISAAISTSIDRMQGKRSDIPWWKKAREKHAHAHGHDAHAHGKDSFSGAFWDSTKHWVVGEMAGDFGAILPSVAIQHYAPRFMSGLRKGLEPVFGPLFRKSTERAARQQATAFGMEADPAAVKARAAALYEYEMAHLPLAFTWTAVSAAINLTVQKKVMGSDASWLNLIASKAGTAGLATGSVFLVRSLAPTQLQKFEAGINDRVITPAARTVGKLAGIDEKKIETALDVQETPKEWAERIKSEKEQQHTVATGRS